MTKNPVLFSALEELLAAYARVIRAWSEPREFWCVDIDDRAETVKILGRQLLDLVTHVDDARQALLKTDFNVPDTWLAVRVRPIIRSFRADQQVKPPIPASGTDIEKLGHSAIRDAPGEWYVVADPLDPEPLAAVCREIDVVIQQLRAELDLVGAKVPEKPDPGTEQGGKQVASRLLSIYTSGLADERLDRMENILKDENLTAEDKLWQIDGLLPIPPTVSGKKLGELVGVSKTAVQLTSWYITNRKGRNKEKVARRQENHRKRSQQSQSDRQNDDDD